MSPQHLIKQDSAHASRPIKKIKQKQQQQQQQQQQQRHTSHTILNAHTYNQPIVLDDDEQSPFPPPPPPPPRKDKHKKQQQKDKDNKKKRSRGETDATERKKATAASASTPRPAAAAGPEAEGDSEDDEEEADSTLKPGDNDDEADDEIDVSKRVKKKLKKTADSANSASAAGVPVKPKTNRLVLRLPRSKGFGPSTKTHLTKPNTSPARHGATHPSALSRTVTSSPQSSSDLSAVDLDDLPEDAISQLGLDAPQLSVHFAGIYDSESSDGYSDLLDDDEDDLLEAEEAYLIADKLQRQGRHSRRGTTSPGAKRNSDGAHSDAESVDAIHGGHSSHYPIDAESVLFEIAQLRDGTTTSEADLDSAKEVAVTWSEAEDDDILDGLDEFLGITTDDSAALRAMQNDPSTGEEQADDGQTMRFEDFLGQDDGSDSEESDSTEEESSSDDEEHSVAATGTDAADREDDDDLETTKDVVKKGGFVFFKASHDDDDETESECELPQDVEDDGGDTTDTLDDTDHLGMIRFGIEAAESDDEDAEEVLANAIRDRNLIDAHNMGLSVSIEALAEQPEAVVLKTARSLGISTETAAKILTSVGMSILMRSHGHDRDVFAEPRPSASSSKEPAVSNPQAAPSASTSIPTSSTATPVALNIRSATTAGQSIPQTVSKTFEPVLGDFAPSGEADLCVVVGATDAPAPSPFSARKRRTRTSTRGFTHPSPNGRGQSVTSTISTQSAASGRRYHSSEEPQYNFILDLDDLVDPSMLPSGMSSVSEEEEELDDTASVSTAMGAASTVVNAGVGDVSRWNRIPIGAFRSQNPTDFASIASAVFSGTRDPAATRDLSFHDGVTFTASGSGSRRRRSRYIPVSPVLFPVGQTFKALSAVQARKERRKDRKAPREGSRAKRVKVENGQSTSNRSRPSSRRNSVSNDNFLSLPQDQQNSLPSDGLTHYVSPLFSGVTSGMPIPSLSLS